MRGLGRKQAHEAIQDCAVQAALALAQEFFSFTTEQGQRGVPLDQAHVFTARRVDLWDQWEALPPTVHELFGRLWQVLREEGHLAQREAFFEAALEQSVEPGALFGLPQGASVREARWVEVCHAQKPLDLAERLVAEAETYRAVLDDPQPAAGEGLWSFGPDGAFTVAIPHSEKGAQVPPVTLRTTPFKDHVELPASAVLDHVRAQAATDPARFGWKPALLQGFFNKLTDAFGRTVASLRLPAGALSLLNAPTGVGKSVLMRDAAQLLALTGQGPVLLVVGRVRESLASAEQMEAEDALVHAAAASMQAAAARTGKPLNVVAWVAPSRHRQQAALGLAQGHLARFEQFGTGCEMVGWQVDGPPMDPDQPPCDQLRWAGDDGTASSQGRHLCPRTKICRRYDHVRRAAEADVIVTNHHNLVRGRCKLPVEVDGTRVVRDMSAMEFMLRRCRVVIIDEIDHFQSTWCAMGAREFLLTSRGGRHNGRLEEVDRQRNRLSSLANLPVTPALLDARKLSESFLDNVLANQLWLESAQERNNRPGSGWYVPGSKDADLCHALTGADPDAEISEAAHRAYLRLFPDTTEGRLPQGWEPLAEQLAQAIDGRGRTRQLAVIKHEMATILSESPFNIPAPNRADLINDLLVRTWLGGLHKALHELKWAVRGVIAQLPAASDLARALGELTRDEPLPYGALGAQLSGFKLDKTRNGGGRLMIQSMGGDPHTATVHLGNTVALATAGVRRSVLGLSATAYFPGAAEQHIHTLPAYVMTDAAPGAVTARAGHVSASPTEWQPISIGGLEETRKPDEIRLLGERLWHEYLGPHLEDLARNDPQRELALLAGNSYHHAQWMAAGVIKACGHPEWVAVLVRSHSEPTVAALPPGVVQVTIDELEDLPRTHPRVKVVCAPLGLVSRGLNILIPGTDRSALASVWVGVRPVTQLHSPTTLYASINAQGIAAAVPGPDPAAMLQTQRRAAFARKDLLLRTDPRFSRMKRFLKAEVLAGILVELIQLAGRARRGGTPVELYLVDHAFFNLTLGCDFPALLRTYYDNLDAEQQQMLCRIYGSTLTAWLDLAHHEGALPHPVALLPAPAPFPDDEEVPSELS
ncbi:hypothetical protein ACWCPS_38510 [Streptomyces mauvecolor]